MPFLDRDFLDVAMTLNPEEKMIRKSEGRMEKYILRKVLTVRKEEGREAGGMATTMTPYDLGGVGLNGAFPGIR